MFLQVLEEVKVSREMDRETLLQVAGTSLRTKLSQKVADIVTEVYTLPLSLSSTSRVCVCDLCRSRWMPCRQYREKENQLTFTWWRSWR